MPYSKKFLVKKIEVDFYLSDGGRKSIETMILDKKLATQEYNDALAEGKTAILSFTQS